MLVHWESSFTSNSSIALSIRFPHVAREPSNLLLSFSGKLNAKAHVSRHARVSTLRVLAAPRHAGRFSLRRRQGVIGINVPAFLNKHAVLLLRDRHEVPFLDLKGVEDLARDDHLPALSYPGDPFFRCGCFCGHAFYITFGTLFRLQCRRIPGFRQTPFPAPFPCPVSWSVGCRLGV